MSFMSHPLPPFVPSSEALAGYLGASCRAVEGAELEHTPHLSNPYRLAGEEHAGNLSVIMPVWEPCYLEFSEAEAEAIFAHSLESLLCAAYEAHPDKGGYYGARKVRVAPHVAPNDAWLYNGAWLFSCGAYGDTYVLAYGALEDTLENAATLLRDIAPGCFTEPDYEGARMDAAEDARNAFCQEQYGASYSNITPDQRGRVIALRDQWQLPLDDERVREHAEQDLTYTESGWIASWECEVIPISSYIELLDFVNNK